MPGPGPKWKTVDYQPMQNVSWLGSTTAANKAQAEEFARQYAASGPFIPGPPASGPNLSSIGPCCVPPASSTIGQA